MRRLLLGLFLAAGLHGQVTYERLLRAAEEPQNWLTYSGTYTSQRYSLLDQITPANVRNLQLEWVHQVRSTEKFETTPLVVDGVMYLTEPPSNVVALDATSGRVFWIYDHRPSPEARLCCGNVNKGVGMLGDTLFVATVDARLVALDARSGAVLWDSPFAAPETGYSATLAPLVIKDKVIIGVGGGEYGIRGFLAAYDAKTGREVWRFYTVAGPGEAGSETWEGDSWKRGGGSVWVTGSYDPDLNLTYWGVGNPGPDYDKHVRRGDNLYTDSVVALDAETGKLKWHFQFTPHDELDYDSVQIPVLVDMDWQGEPRKLMLWANRNGFWYVLDRATGEFLQGKLIDKVTWAKGLDAKGRPIQDPSKVLTSEGQQIFPGVQGTTNWYSPSYSPRTGLFYVSTWVNYSTIYSRRPSEYVEGRMYTSGYLRTNVPSLRRGSINTWGDAASGAVRAFDPQTGAMEWEFKMSDVTDSGILTTASDVLFTGGREGYFYALDARNGEMLWRAILGGQVSAGPMTYKVGDKQYVSIASGSSLFTFALREE
jgi:alcohol dehydrogenase (cytochrome c)